jgi:hypothetical protein
MEVWAEGEEGPQMHFFGGEQAMDDFLLAPKLPQASASRTSLIRYRLFPRTARLFEEAIASRGSITHGILNKTNISHTLEDWT